MHVPSVHGIANSRPIPDDSWRAQGLTATRRESFYDVSADLGGRSSATSLWFYGAYGAGKTKECSGSPEVGADGKYLTADTCSPTPTRRSHRYPQSCLQLTKNNGVTHAAGTRRSRRTTPAVHAARSRGLQESDRDSEDRAPEHAQSRVLVNRRRYSGTY